MSQSFETFGQLCPLTYGRLAEAQHVAQMLDDTPRLVPPPGGWRTKRCEHGLRCDSIEWLCEVCAPKNNGRVSGERAAACVVRECRFALQDSLSEEWWRKVNKEAINSLAQECFDMASSKGFHDEDGEPNRIAVYIANLHGEASELWEAHRAGALNLPCNKNIKLAALGIEPLTNLEEELADIVIRALDTSIGLGVDIGSAIERKMAYNASRPRMHGKIC